MEQQQGLPNSCSYADLAAFDTDKRVLQAKRNTLQEMRWLYGRYSDDCLHYGLVLWKNSNYFLK